MNAPATAAQVATSKESHIEVFNGGVAMVGKDAVMLFAATALLRGLNLYQKNGMLLTRGMTGPRMLALATSYTKKEYKGKDRYANAVADLQVWTETMRTAMPVVDSTKPPSP